MRQYDKIPNAELFYLASMIDDKLSPEEIREILINPLNLESVEALNEDERDDFREHLFPEAAQEVSDIQSGAGWATDRYIMNFCELSNRDKFQVLIMLANLGILYDEEKISESESQSEYKPRAIAKMTKAQVIKIYSKQLN